MTLRSRINGYQTKTMSMPKQSLPVELTFQAINGWDVLAVVPQQSPTPNPYEYCDVYLIMFYDPPLPAPTEPSKPEPCPRCSYPFNDEGHIGRDV